MWGVRRRPLASEDGSRRYTYGDTARAYTAEKIREGETVNDEVGSLPVVVSTAADGTLVAYVREVGGATFVFEPDDERHLLASESRWLRSTGVAIDGPYRGTHLVRANDVSPLFWFAWVEFHPNSELYE